MEKLGQLHRQALEDGSYDLIVVDTPPSRSALDFLDSPERLSSFLDGRLIRLLLAPARGPVRLVTRRLLGDHRRADQGPRRPDAARRADLRRRPRHPLRQLPPAGGEDLRAAAGRRHGVRGRRRARARRAARGGVLRGPAHRGRHAAGRPGGQPGQPLGAHRASRPRRRSPRPTGCARATARHWPPACCSCTPTGCASSSASSTCASASPPRTRRCRRPSSRRCRATSTTSTGCG